MNRYALGVVLVSLILASCKRVAKIADPTWKDVVAGTNGLSDAAAMEGHVLFYEERHGLREQQRLAKVVVSKQRLESLLKQWSLDPEIKECTHEDFRKWSSDRAWVLPKNTTVVPCTVGKIKVRGHDAWVATGYMTEPRDDGTQLVFLGLVGPIYE
jgi:hypothetical protein